MAAWLRGCKVDFHNLAPRRREDGTFRCLVMLCRLTMRRNWTLNSGALAFSSTHPSVTRSPPSSLRTTTIALVITMPDPV